MRVLPLFFFVCLFAKAQSLSLGSFFNGLLGFSEEVGDPVALIQNNSSHVNESTLPTVEEYEYQDIESTQASIGTTTESVASEAQTVITEATPPTPLAEVDASTAGIELGDYIDINHESASVEGSGEEVPSDSILGDNLLASTTIFPPSMSTLEEILIGAPHWTTTQSTVNATKDGKFDFSFAKPTVTCSDGSLPEYSLHGSTYCWSHSVCPTGTACIDSQCCRTALASSIRKCPESQWECGDGTCLRAGLRCDSLLDCTDNSDELFCYGNEKRSVTHGGRCNGNEFQCDSGECIPSTGECDRKYDCKDGSDELKCAHKNQQTADQQQAQRSEQQQQDQRHHQQQSNHISEVADPRQAGECSDQEFRCPYLSYTKCIHYEKLCDGRDDCGDNSDEQKCESGSIEDCASGEFRCNNGQCISADLKCNHKYDCEDGTDESTCEYFIASQKRRDHEKPADNQIEQVHPAISRDEAERQRRLQEREQEIQRRENEEKRRENEERRREGEERRREEEQRRREEELRRREEEERRRHQEFTSNVVHSNAPTIQFNQEYDDDSCLEHEFMCHTGECIDKRRLCDTRDDCLDGSDERDCHNGRHTGHPAPLPPAPPVIEDDWPELPEEEPYDRRHEELTRPPPAPATPAPSPATPPRTPG